MVLPHSISGEDVELCAAGAVGEDGCSEANVAFEDESVVAPFLVGEGSEGDGAGDVGGAAVVRCAAVEEQQSAGLQRYVGFGGGLVVDDGAVGAIAGNGVEGDVTEARLLGAQGGELAVDAYLRHGLQVGTLPHP